MNRLNPIYILALVVTFFIISITLLNNKKNEFNSLNYEFNGLKVKIKDFNEYKKTWFDEKKTIQKIDRMVKSPIFVKEKILKTQNNGIVRIKLESKDPNVLNKFLNRFLNEKFIIKKLDVKKESILMEIGLK